MGKARHGMGKSLADQLIRYLETLVMTGGDCDGEKFNVMPWEEEFLIGAFHDTDLHNSFLSVARGNGKTGLVSGVATAVIDPDGPLHGNKREVDCVASSMTQTRHIFEDVCGFLVQKFGNLPRHVLRKRDSTNKSELIWEETRAKLVCMASNPKSVHGIRPYLILADEPAQWESSKAPLMYSALKTSLGKMPGSRLIGLGTRPKDDAHWFARQLRNKTGRHYVQVHTIDKNDDRLSEETWKKANPSWDYLPSLRAKIREDAEDAREDEDEMASFSALRLNSGESEVLQNFVIAPEVWKKCIITDDSEAPMEGPRVWGIDLGSSYSQSAVSCYWPTTGRLDAIAAFPREPNLLKRGQQEGVGDLYKRMHDLGELMITGELAIDHQELFEEAEDRFGPPTVMCFDTWKEKEGRDALSAAGIGGKLDLRRQGYKEGGEDLRSFRKYCAKGFVKAVPNLLLTVSLSEARVERDAAGNMKISKTAEGRRARAKDDTVVSSVLAVAGGSRHYPRKMIRDGRIETLVYAI